MTRPRTVIALDLAARGLTSTEIAAELGQRIHRGQIHTWPHH